MLHLKMKPVETYDSVIRRHFFVKLVQWNLNIRMWLCIGRPIIAIEVRWMTVMVAGLRHGEATSSMDDCFPSDTLTAIKHTLARPHPVHIISYRIILVSFSSKF